MTDEEIPAAWAGIQDRLSTAGVAVFPASPDGADADWPDDDWSGFLDVAVHCGARLVYATADRVTADDLDRMRADLDATGEVASDELRAAMKAARTMVGQPCRIELAFGHNGLTHRWTAETSWLADIDEATTMPEPIRSVGTPDHDLDGSQNRPHWTSDEFEARRQAELDRLADQVEEWAALLSEHPDYLAARNQSLRQQVACKVIPDLDAWRTLRGARHAASPEDVARQSAAWETLRSADHLQSEVKARRIADAKAHAHEWVTDLQLARDFADARTADQRRRRAGEYVANRLGFTSADVRDRLLELIAARPAGPEDPGGRPAVELPMT